MQFLSATIGGHLGLFLGASLLSFIQIMEYLTDETLLCLGCMKSEDSTEDITSGSPSSNGTRAGHNEHQMVVQNGGKNEDNKLSAISGAPTVYHQNL